MKVWVLATLLVIVLPSVMAWSYRLRRHHDDHHHHHHHGDDDHHHHHHHDDHHHHHHHNDHHHHHDHDHHGDHDHDHDECCLPDQYESLVKVQLAGDEPSASRGYGRVAMDYKRKLFAMNQTLVPGRATLSDTIYDGNAYVMYTIDFVSGTCSVAATPGLVIPQRCVSREDAQPVDLGREVDDSVKPAQFQFEENSETVSLVMNMNDCTMMKRAVQHAEGGVRVESYFDTSIGIRDRSVFNIPAACEEAVSNMQK